MTKSSKASKAEMLVRAAAPEGPVMYVGPTKGLLGLTRNTVYTEVPKTAKELIEKLPKLRRLFISLSQFPKAEEQIKAKRGFVYDAYKELAAWKPEIGGDEA